MEYKFRSKFDREKEYTINADVQLNLYDTFSLSIKKIDNDKKAFSYDNIDCILKYCKTSTKGLNKYELDKTNFSGYYAMVELFKDRKCISMGEPIELIQNETQSIENQDITIENATQEMKDAFNDFIKQNNIIDLLFQSFLKGVSYGKENKQREQYTVV